MSPNHESPDTIVLVHGLWMTPRSWENWVEALREPWLPCVDTRLPRLRGRGRGATCRRVADRARHRSRDRRAPRRHHQGSRAATDPDGSLLWWRPRSDPARPRVRRSRRRDRLRPDGRRLDPAAVADQGHLPDPEQPGQSPSRRRLYAGAVPLRLHEHALRGRVSEGLRALLHPGPRELGVGRRPCQLHAGSPGDLGRLRQQRPCPAAVHRRRRGPHHAGCGQLVECREVREVECHHRLRGVPRAIALHRWPGRLGGGRRLRPPVGDRECPGPRQCRPWSDPSVTTLPRLRRTSVIGAAFDARAPAAPRPIAR